MIVLSNQLDVHECEVALPRLPATLAGFRMVHLTDMHIRQPTDRLMAILECLGRTAHDLTVITGDIMHRPGHEPAAAEFLLQLTRRAKPRYGMVGCFGNHDTHELQRRARHLPIVWLDDQVWHHPDVPLTVAGLDCEYFSSRTGDAVAMMLDDPPEGTATDAPVEARLRVLLSHVPRWLPAASAAGFDLMISGHTHGGQCRLPGRRALYNATQDWPLPLTSGVVGMGDTVGLISRGLGESTIERFRIFCPPMLPIITLQPGGATQPMVPTVIEKW